jgi:hypothetical protein
MCCENNIIILLLLVDFIAEIFILFDNSFIYSTVHSKLVECGPWSSMQYQASCYFSYFVFSMLSHSKNKTDIRTIIAPLFY